MNTQEATEDRLCELCNKRTDSLAGDPGRWPVRIYTHHYHWECAHLKIIENDSALREENAKLKQQLEKRSRSKINPYDTYAVAKELEKTKKYRKS